MYLGSWAINDVLTFSVNTHSFSTGVATNADAAPTYRVYEDNTATPILTGTMAAFDSANAVGQYVAQITLSAANGFEVGKTYTIRIAATVGGVTGACVRTFQVGAKVNTTLLAGTTQTARDIGNALPAAAPGASGGLPTTDGTKINQTAVLTSAEHTLISGTDVPSALTAQGYTITRAGYLDALNGLVAAIWNALTSGMATVGSVGKRISDYLDVAVSSRGTGTALDATGVRSAVGLASANLDTQLSGISGKTSLIPASPAAVGSAMTLAANSVNAAAIATAAIDGDSIAADAVTKLQNGLSTYTGADTPGTTTLLSRLTASWASLLDVAVSTRGTGIALTAADVRAAIGMATANLDAQIASLPTTTVLNSRSLPTASYALQSSLDAHLPMAVKRNQALGAFTFIMLDSTDHITPKSGLTVTAKRKLDGGSWASCANAVTFDATAPVPTYMIDLAAADLNGAVVTLSFTASGADPLQITILTQA
jgi:hypothetical protein